MVRTLLACLLIAAPTFAQTGVPTYIVTTFAGSAPLGDGGPASSASFRWPHSLAFDSAGNLYIADDGNASIRRVTPDGFITTVAGTGTAGFSGDGGPANRAQLSSFIVGIAINAAGDIYISDDGNNRVRVVSAEDGRIRTFVDGNQFPKPVSFGFSGIALDAEGNLYLAIQSYNQIYRFAPDGTSSVFAGTGASGDAGDGGPASEATFSNLANLHIDASGTMYVSELVPSRIRKITPDGTISAFAGTGQIGFSGDGGSATQAALNEPSYMTSDAGGNFYFVDTLNYRIRKVAKDGTISTVSGNGSNISFGDGLPATQAQIFPLGITSSSSGDLYVANGDALIRVIRAADGIVNTVYGQLHFAPDGSLAENALFDFPFSFVGDGNGNFYIGDWFRLRKIDSNGVISTIAGSVSSIAGPPLPGNTGDGGPGTAATMSKAYAIAVDSSGTVYFGSGGRVRRVGTDGIITTFAGSGTATVDGGPATAAALSSTIYGLAVDSSGLLYIADSLNHRIRKVMPDGTIWTIAGAGTGGDSGDGGPATAAQIRQPYGLAFDATGNLYFADYPANRVRKIAPDGTISAFAGTGTAGETGDGGPATAATLNGPHSVAIDATGNVYISDFLGNTLRVVTQDGNIHTIASGSPVDNKSYFYSVSGPFGGDGGPAIGNHYGGIMGVAFDGSSNIYLLDNCNERIRVLTPNQ